MGLQTTRQSLLSLSPSPNLSGRSKRVLADAVISLYSIRSHRTLDPHREGEPASCLDDNLYRFSFDCSRSAVITPVWVRNGSLNLALNFLFALMPTRKRTASDTILADSV